MKYIRKFSFISLLLVVAIAGAAVPAFAADVNDIYNLLNNTTNTYLNTIKNSNAQIESYSLAMSTRLTNIYNDIHTYLPSLQQINNQISIYAGSAANTLNDIRGSLINTNGSIYSELHSVNQNVNTIKTDVGNIKSGLNATLPDIKDSVVQLQEVLASDEDLAIRQGQQQRVNQITDDFLDSTGDASVSLGDLGSAKDSVSQIKGAMSGGASASSLWNVLANTSNAWSWFSQATADDLDSTGSSSRMRSSSSQYTYLDEYYRELGLSLGGNYND